MSNNCNFNLHFLNLLLKPTGHPRRVMRFSVNFNLHFLNLLLKQFARAQKSKAFRSKFQSSFSESTFETLETISYSSGFTSDFNLHFLNLLLKLDGNLCEIRQVQDFNLHFLNLLLKQDSYKWNVEAYNEFQSSFSESTFETEGMEKNEWWIEVNFNLHFLNLLLKLQNSGNYHSEFIKISIFIFWIYFWNFIQM